MYTKVVLRDSKENPPVVNPVSARNEPSPELTLVNSDAEEQRRESQYVYVSQDPVVNSGIEDGKGTYRTTADRHIEPGCRLVGLSADEYRGMRDIPVTAKLYERYYVRKNRLLLTYKQSKTGYIQIQGSGKPHIRIQLHHCQRQA